MCDVKCAVTALYQEGLQEQSTKYTGAQRSGTKNVFLITSFSIPCAASSQSKNTKDSKSVVILQRCPGAINMFFQM